MKALDNLVKVNQLKVEPADTKEIQTLVKTLPPIE